MVQSLCREDRSYNQTRNPYVVFSPDFENLISLRISVMIKQIIKTAYWVGRRRGGEQSEKNGIRWTKSRMYGRLAYIDMKCLPDARNASTNNGAISNAKYIEMLRKDGFL